MINSREEKLEAMRDAIIRANQRAIERCYAGDDPVEILDDVERELLDYALCMCGHFHIEHSHECDMEDCRCKVFEAAQ